MQGEQRERERVGEKNNIKPFSKTCWPRLVKQHQGLQLKTGGGRRGRGKHTSRQWKMQAGRADACRNARV